MDIKNKVFIITGGASGLGAGTARMLVAEGASVVLADVQDEAGEQLAAELGQTYVHCDVTQEADGQAAVAAALNVGKLFGLVNCAGVAPASRIVGKNGPHALDLFQKVVMINLVGTFNMSRLAAAAMSENTPESTGERGVLINTASVAAYDGQIGQAAYAASKAGVVGMTLPVARDLSKVGIRCVTIAPGIFGTPMIFGMPQEVQDSLAASIPFPTRLGRPEDYAKLVNSIITNEMINGETIRLDGAIRMAPK
ncbi:3-hydroxyacyl-CoA dehydrogenase [Pollutimonas subterranea]|uniref:3-hydroxyacyl-CoA dehydrogenase n=1 Tax=Pollutimonas subterranea TaxID=2045210 RepID=A0A2N4U086_9BURK|nr:3-hydroxyacyl-CoA dehydrogenase [Pollutimonas subterranea]PLC48428.1 3-hydroxyacyl-CoA dehydrogenase [Pollutimonas subterranea]